MFVKGLGTDFNTVSGQRICKCFLVYLQEPTNVFKAFEICNFALATWSLLKADVA
jgi:hypothetical protein